MLPPRHPDYRDLAADDAYRAWLISRNPPPIVHHSGDMQWKRLRVLVRRAIKQTRRLVAAGRVALLAERVRLARRDLARHGGARDRSAT